MRKINLFFSSLFLSLFFAAAASGAVFTVTKTADTNDGVCDADCSLREAVAAANAGTGNTVKFSPSLAGATIVLTLGEIQLGAINIAGLGADQITISGNNSSRIFNVLASGGNSKISGVTLTGGHSSGSGVFNGGGAIFATGLLIIDGVYFNGNTAGGTDGKGGALFYAGANGNIIRNSTFVSNTGADGGAIKAGGDLTVINSTFTQNSSATGGAISIIGITVTVLNSTMTGNTGAGGQNSVYSGGIGSHRFGNSIILGIYRAFDNSNASSLGNNIAVSSSGSKPVSYLPSDQIGIDPLLGSLQNNGGTTSTFALQAGSPAIDAGSNALVIAAGYAVDQRRYVRTVDGNGDMNAVVDIGAYEFGSSPATPISFSGRVHDAAGNGVGRATVTVTDSEGNVRSITTSPLGYFVLNDIYVGNILVEISAKSHRFTPITIYATQNIVNMELAVQ